MKDVVTHKNGAIIQNVGQKIKYSSTDLPAFLK